TRGVRFTERGIDLQCLLLRRFRSRVPLTSIQTAVNGQHGLAVSQARVRTRVTWVHFHRLLKMAQGLFHTVYRSLVPAVPAPQVQLISLWILGVPSSQSRVLLRCQPQPQAVRDLGGDFILDGKNICELSLVLLTPKL